MISKKEVIKIHSILIDQFGGSHGVRDYDLLDSAVNRPIATFGNEELYPTPIDKAAAILESIVKNHPFLDGSKRTGYVLARLLLLQSQLDIKVSQEEKYEMIVLISIGKMSF